MKKYYTPEVTVISCSQEDLMLGSDTFVDVGTLWSDEELGNDETPAE